MTDRSRKVLPASDFPCDLAKEFVRLVQGFRVRENVGASPGKVFAETKV